MSNENYVPYGEEWKKEILKNRKEVIVDLYQKGMQHKNIIPSGSLEEAQRHAEGIINDFEGGILSKAETMEAIGEYTGRLMDIFWIGAKKQIKADPSLLDSW